MQQAKIPGFFNKLTDALLFAASKTARLQFKYVKPGFANQTREADTYSPARWISKPV